jgi:vesicle coat complex subunit
MTTNEEVIFLSTLSSVKDEYSACSTASLIAQINAMNTLTKIYNPLPGLIDQKPDAVWHKIKDDVIYLLYDREQLLTEVLKYLSSSARRRNGTG